MQPERKATDATEENDPCVRLTRELIRIPSITAIEPQYQDASNRCLALAEDFARTAGAEVTRLSYSGGHAKWDYPVENAYIEWTFG
jgi:hypothetical protein